MSQVPLRAPWLMPAVWCVALSVCTAASAQPTEEHAWRDFQGKRWTIRYADAVQRDVAKINEFLQAADAAMSQEFATHQPETLLEGLSLTVYIHPVANSLASTYTMSLQTSYSGTRCTAELHLLAPSLHGPADLTNVGEPKDDVYFHKTIVHEYSTLFLGALSRSKDGGWRFNSSPAWFVQGYEEYLALMHSTPHSRQITLRKYEELVRSDPARVDLSLGVDVRDPYTHGAVLLAFLHDEFGKERVQSVLLSPEPTFGRALSTTLGVDLGWLSSRWHQWIERQQ